MKMYAGKIPLKTFIWKNQKYKFIKAEQHEKENSDKSIIVVKAVKRNT